MTLGVLFACGKDSSVDDTGPLADDTGTVDTTDSDAGDDTAVATDDTAVTVDDTAITGDDTGDSGDTADSGDTGDTGPVYDVCDDYPALPLEPDWTDGWSGAEDFTLDGEGYYVSIEENGTLTRRNRAGDEIIVRPGLGYAAGIHMMPEGEHIAYADIENNAIVRVSLVDGGSEVLLAGLSYPNGVEVGLDGMIYVAEHGAGRVLQIDPKTGESTTLATDMYSPNGIAFGPDHNTLYWNSFGDGGVYAVTRDGDGWTEPFTVGATPESSTWWDGIIEPCGGAVEGDSCTDLTGGYGQCSPSPSPGGGGSGELSCRNIDTETPCDGLETGDVCTNVLFGVDIENVCVEESAGGGGPGGPSTILVCPLTPVELSEPCDGAGPMAACEIDEVAGTCLRNWENEPICVDEDVETQRTIDACKGMAELDPCTVGGDYQPTSGACQDSGDGTLACQGSSSSSYRGGLDGLNVDECGNIYVTEYVEGLIWKFPADESGADAELVATMPSYWIPNLHWGNGVGGWETDVLYVAERGGYGPGSSSRVFELDIVVGGAPEAFTPEITDTTADTGVTD